MFVSPLPVTVRASGHSRCFRQWSCCTSVEEVREQIVLPVHRGEHERCETATRGRVRPSPAFQELRGEDPVSVLGGHQEGAASVNES